MYTLYVTSAGGAQYFVRCESETELAGELDGARRIRTLQRSNASVLSKICALGAEMRVSVRRGRPTAWTLFVEFGAVPYLQYSPRLLREKEWRIA